VDKNTIFRKVGAGKISIEEAIRLLDLLKQLPPGLDYEITESTEESTTEQPQSGYSCNKMKPTEDESGATILIKIAIGIAVLYGSIFLVGRWMNINRDQYKPTHYRTGPQELTIEESQALSEDDDRYYREQDSAAEPRGRYGY
jgi:hypothetical protein